MKKSRFISYIYSGLFLVVILIILIENSYLLINQTSSNLVETSWLEGEKLVKSIVAGAQQSIESVQLTPQQIRRQIRKITVKIDHLGDLSGKRIEEDLKEILRNNKLRSISILDEAGNVINT
ncbi:MAG: hypothetical protein GY866_29005, partial [Proteobacteria bacterium]|nr:hypothetical protein [Pseudomonadota bacterium]